MKFKLDIITLDKNCLILNKYQSILTFQIQLLSKFCYSTSLVLFYSRRSCPWSISANENAEQATADTIATPTAVQVPTGKNAA